MTILRRVLAAGCTALLALTGVSPAVAGMIHSSPHQSGSSRSRGDGNRAPKAPQQSQQKPKSSKPSKTPKSGKNGKGAGSATNGTGSPVTDSGNSNTSSDAGGTAAPPDVGTVFDPPTIADPPADIGLPDVVPPPGAGTLGAGLGGGIGFGSDSGPFPGDNVGGDLPLLLTGGPEGTGGGPPLQLLEFNSPLDNSALSPFDVTNPGLTDLDPPQHMPEPSSMILALLGGGCTIFSQLHRRGRRHDEMC